MRVIKLSFEYAVVLPVNAGGIGRLAVAVFDSAL